MNYKTEFYAMLGPLEAAARLDSWEDAGDFALELARLAKCIHLTQTDPYEQQIKQALEDKGLHNGTTKAEHNAFPKGRWT